MLAGSTAGGELPPASREDESSSASGVDDCLNLDESLEMWQSSMGIESQPHTSLGGALTQGHNIAPLPYGIAQNLGGALDSASASSGASSGACICCQPCSVKACFCQPPNDEPTNWLEPKEGRFWCIKCNEFVIRVNELPQSTSCKQLATIGCSGRKQDENLQLNRFKMRFQCMNSTRCGGGKGDPRFDSLHYTCSAPGNQDHLRIWCDKKGCCIGSNKCCACLRKCLVHGTRDCKICTEAKGRARKRATPEPEVQSMPRSLGDAGASEPGPSEFRSLSADVDELALEVHALAIEAK